MCISRTRIASPGGSLSAPACRTRSPHLSCGRYISCPAHHAAVSPSTGPMAGLGSPLPPGHLSEVATGQRSRRRSNRGPIRQVLGDGSCVRIQLAQRMGSCPTAPVGPYRIQYPSIQRAARSWPWIRTVPQRPGRPSAVDLSTRRTTEPTPSRTVLGPLQALSSRLLALVS